VTHSIRRDAIFVLFGAPVWKEDDAERAVACAIAMQLAMDSINEQNRLENLPEIEMGIGVHTGQVVVGNIGSPQPMKYDVIGSQVNLTSRIQSCTTGGQILISETTRQESGRILKLGRQMEVKAKGVEQPVLWANSTHRFSLAERLLMRDEVWRIAVNTVTLWELLRKRPNAQVLPRFLLACMDAFVHTRSLTEDAMRAPVIHIPIFARLRGKGRRRSVQEAESNGD
jgi:hypothetical protein